MFYSPEKNSIIPQKNEVLRYLGYLRTSPIDSATDALIDSCISEMQSVICPKAVYEIFDLAVSGDEIKFADVTINSKDLARNLNTGVSKTGIPEKTDDGKSALGEDEMCSKIAILAATIGMQADALIKRTTKLDVTKAAILQATGAMFIEEVVDGVAREIESLASAERLSVRPRYSPGYGDVPLTVQKDFFRLLPCTKIGLSLMDSLVMAPEKSVTAFIGIGRF